jgi:hypothetical protein
MKRTRARKADVSHTPAPKGALQRSALRTDEVSEVPPVVHEVLREPGQPLDVATREFFEPLFGADFSGVRVHVGSKADESARSVEARAYAVGRDVVFGECDYTPNTITGRRLIAHELTHVIQQARASGSTQGQCLEVGTAQSASEQEAERVAERIASGSVCEQVRGTASSQVMRAAPAVAGVATKVAQRALKWLAKKGANVSAHVAKRHVAKRLGKSTFLDGGKFVKKWVTETLEHADKVTAQGRRVVFEKMFNREVGQGGERIVRVVVDRATGKIVTAFPSRAFKEIVTAAAVTATATAAGEADAAIEARRTAIAEALKPGFIESIIDFFFAPSSVARDEDYLAEERIVQDKIQQAISEIERQMQMSLAPDQREEVREMILLEMAHEPSVGVVGE